MSSLTKTEGLQVAIEWQLSRIFKRCSIALWKDTGRQSVLNGYIFFTYRVSQKMKQYHGCPVVILPDFY